MGQGGFGFCCAEAEIKLFDFSARTGDLMEFLHQKKKGSLVASLGDSLRCFRCLKYIVDLYPFTNPDKLSFFFFSTG